LRAIFVLDPRAHAVTLQNALQRRKSGELFC